MIKRTVTDWTIFEFGNGRRVRVDFTSSAGRVGGRPLGAEEFVECLVDFASQMSTDDVCIKWCLQKDLL